MDALYLEVDLGNRPNSRRVARLLREIQSACLRNRRHAGVKLLQGRERRVAPGKVAAVLFG